MIAPSAGDVADKLRALDAELSVLHAAARSRKVSRLSLSLTLEGIRSRVVDQANALDELQRENEPIPYRLNEVA